MLALHLTGVIGPRRLKAARTAFPDLADLFGATEEALSELPDWTPSCARKVLGIQDGERSLAVERELEEAAAHGIEALLEEDPAYPAPFRDLYDPPFVLWRWGGSRDADAKAIAVIGCRKPSPYGQQAAFRLAQDIARSGYVVVSGLARGIDSTAHLGALQVPGGRTLAFLGSGLLNLYPSENRKLAERIRENGALYSEYPLRAKPMAMHFPQRNRLISAASRGVLVVEANMDSGSFITVDHANDQGRPVFAVPGPITHAQSEGTHALIQQGAKLVMGVEDIFHELGDLRAGAVARDRSAVRTPPIGSLTGEEEALLGKLDMTPRPIDVLAREAGIEARRLNEMLLSMEMKGWVRQAPGHCYFRL